MKFLVYIRQHLKGHFGINLLVKLRKLLKVKLEEIDKLLVFWKQKMKDLKN